MVQVVEHGGVWGLGSIPTLLGSCSHTGAHWERSHNAQGKNQWPNPFLATVPSCSPSQQTFTGLS